MSQYERAVRHDDDTAVLDYLRLTPTIQQDMDATNALIAQFRYDRQFGSQMRRKYRQSGSASGRDDDDQHGWLWPRRRHPITTVAARRGWTEVIAWFFCRREHVDRIGAILVNMFSESLHAASSRDRLDIVEMLLQSPVYLELLTDEAQQSALDKAFHSARSDIMCQLLVAHGANVDETDEMDSSWPAMSYQPFIRSSVAKRIRRGYELERCMREVVVVEHDALVVAVDQVKPLSVEALLMRGFVDVDACSPARDGRSALMECVRTPNFMDICREHRPQVVQCLLSFGADTTLRDSQGRTALHLAIAYLNPSCVEVLLDHTIATSGVEAVHGDTKALELAFQLRNGFGDYSQRVLTVLLDRGACLVAYGELTSGRACTVCKDPSRCLRDLKRTRAQDQEHDKI